MNDIITAKDLCLWYGAQQALKNISIGIPVVPAIRGITDLSLDVHLMIDRPVR